MSLSRIPVDEQYRLITECRQSGLSDYQWCLEHDIKPGTFYNWVRRIRQKGIFDIPASPKKAALQSTSKQEVVRLDLNRDTDAISLYESEQVTTDGSLMVQFPATLELEIQGNHVRATNEVDPSLLAQTIQILKGLSC